MKKLLKIFLITSIPFLALGFSASRIQKLFAPEPDHFARMFEVIPQKENFNPVFFDITGSYWPECVARPRYGGPVFSHNKYPCGSEDIGYIDAPSTKYPVHFFPDIKPEERARAIGFFIRNHMLYDGYDFVDFKKGIHP